MNEKIVFDAREIMLAKNVTKADIARATKLRPNTVSDYCAGKFGRLKMGTIKKIMDYLGTRDFNEVFAWKVDEGTEENPTILGKEDDVPHGFVAKFRYMRRCSGTTLEAIAQKLGVSRQCVDQSIKETMTLKRLVELTEAMGATVTITDKDGHCVELKAEDFRKNA